MNLPKRPCQKIKNCKNLILLNRLGKVDDLLGTAVFLASDDANYITGQTISVNGEDMGPINIKIITLFYC